MGSSTTKHEVRSELTGVSVTDDTLSMDLSDGRSIAVPLGWFPRLRHGTQAERNKYELSLAGVHWPDLDEDISVEGLLAGEKSGESPESLKKWLASRGH